SAAIDLAGELSRLDIDARVAVTTVDMLCAVDGLNIFSARGVFNTVAAHAFPPACQYTETVACRDDGMCADALGDGMWACRGYQSDVCLENPNGSTNTSCRRRCTTDAECQAFLLDDRAICQKLSANALDWGCIVPPPTEGCDGVPSTGKPWVERPHLNELRCLASVGVNQESRCFKYEQGLAAAWAAIEPLGPNAVQSSEFLRRDAHLALLIVSDEDDCSVAPGETIADDDYETCALLPTVTDGGPLVEPAEIAQRFIDLKAPDGREVFAVVAVGDSLAEGDAQRDAERDAYVDAKSSERTCYQQSYICEGPLGKSDWGRRYEQFVAAFGDDGAMVNLCGRSAIDGLVTTFIGKLEARLGR
ncbi:MAG: hypothetical protein KC635_23860, partial [Myxococcales bacterium]|nr:hypothetical protein [Myxococcales bacterium]